ncbi:hypothetical protein Tco_0521876 [Tanacetum coccineum]
MEITVVTLVEEQMSSWKGNLPKLPIIIKYSAIGTRKYSGRFHAFYFLLVVIIVTVVIVAVILVVVIVAIVGVVIIVMIIGVVVIVTVVVVGGGVSFIIKLSFVIIGFVHRSWAYAFHQDKASSVRVPVANVTLFSSAYHLLTENSDSVRFLLGLSAFAMAATCASRAAVMPSVISCQMAASVIIGAPDVDDITEILEFKTSRNRYGNNRMSDSIGDLVFLDTKVLRKLDGNRIIVIPDKDMSNQDIG